MDEGNCQPEVYNLVIYRNDEFVAGLIQQIFNIGLPIDEMRETIQASATQQAKELAGVADAEAGFSLPWTASAKARVSGSAKNSGSEDVKDEQKNQRNFQYTQANFLHNVRQQLHNQKLIKPITGIESLEGVKVGSFVEFAATFEANEINSILDLATPELVAAVTKWQAKKDQRAKFDFYYAQGPDELQKFIQKSNLEAEARAEIAAAATSAVRQDFRNETTREYFGKVVGGTARRTVTAVTICDTEYFASQDKDRILDGTFTVLGKISEISMKSTSILSRNKVLNRIQQPMLDELNDSMRDAAQDGKFNTAFKLGLKPPIVKVIPIAIYI